MNASSIKQSATATREPGAETIIALPELTTTGAGEALRYPNTPTPVISSKILTIPPGGKTNWMTHPVPAYLYVLEGGLSVEFTDGKRQRYRVGQAFLQSQTQWHRGVNEGESVVRFLAVFLGGHGIPTILHPPSTI